MTGKGHKRRDEFLVKTRRDLAGRAGHRCSLCEKATSGPGAGPGLVRHNGRAAHITAASRKGPRFDASLTPNQRADLENGIWLCTEHADEIDDVASTYSVDALRGLKQIREAHAKREVQGSRTPEQSSSQLIEFPYVVTTGKLLDLLNLETYDFTTALKLQNMLPLSPSYQRLLGLVPDVIIHTWDTHPNVAGLLATLLCNVSDHWHPTERVMAKLDELCIMALNADDWTRVASVEPLAFALGAQGRTDTQRKVLDRIVSGTQWRERDIVRVKEYYGDAGVELGAIVSHWNDPLRQGLLKANDVGRLMDLVLSNDRTLVQSGGKDKLLDFLLDHARVLAANGATEAARTVADFVAALRLADKDRARGKTE